MNPMAQLPVRVCQMDSCRFLRKTVETVLWESARYI